ncbi:MAG: potassium channel protein [Acidimicrobiia bacterium]|nr:potassium channel protein [Acidimicrobiia bacterium]NNL68631.1 potassium channel protein [Acidimicrobiia bacterium]
MRGLFHSAFLRRVLWHVRRVSKQLDRRFFLSLLAGLVVVVTLAAAAITLIEKDITVRAFGESFYWGITTVLGQGDSSFVTSPGGWAVSWLLALFGIGIFATITGALVGFVIDFLLKEGQGMGAAGYKGHIVVCGWNSTARELIDELGSDEYRADVVVVHDAEKNPAGNDAYFVNGDATKAEDLRRAGIEEASAAIVCPSDASDEADMRSILTVLAIEDLAPEVRTVVEVNNPRHVAHFRRAHVDEVLVSSRLAAHLLARTAMYPGLSGVVSDMVAGGEGSELYRVDLPDDYLGVSIDELSARMRREHQATVLAVTRNGSSFINPPTDFRLEAGDDAVVIAESLGTLQPLQTSKPSREELVIDLAERHPASQPGSNP